MMLDKVIMHDLKQPKKVSNILEESRSIFFGAEIDPQVPPVSPPQELFVNIPSEYWSTNDPPKISDPTLV